MLRRKQASKDILQRVTRATGGTPVADLRLALLVHGAHYQGVPIPNQSPNAIAISGATATLTLGTGFLPGQEATVEYDAEGASSMGTGLRAARVRRPLHRHAERRARALRRRARDAHRLAADPGGAGPLRVRGEPQRDAERDRGRRRAARARHHAEGHDALVKAVAKAATAALA